MIGIYEVLCIWRVHIHFIVEGVGELTFQETYFVLFKTFLPCLPENGRVNIYEDGKGEYQK